MQTPRLSGVEIVAVRSTKSPPRPLAGSGSFAALGLEEKIVMLIGVIEETKKPDA